ncbi:MAG: hypothetical protein OEV15_08960, partial [Gallionella sp.]|nr:hypothetical protein [Gallionella sp.]
IKFPNRLGEKALDLDEGKCGKSARLPQIENIPTILARKLEHQMSLRSSSKMVSHQAHLSCVIVTR